MRHIPNFLVVGAAKAGTTSLYHYLKQHPEVYLPHKKEHFFFAGLKKDMFSGKGSFYGRNIIENWDDYVSIFDEAAAEKAVGEVCVAYLYFYENSIGNILRYVQPVPRIIIILRNPAERAFSNYKHHLRDGVEQLNFDEAIRPEVINRRKGENWWWGFDYIDVGFYHRQVKAYLEAFGKEKVRIYLYEEISRNLLGAMRDMFEFLEVDPSFIPDVSAKHNVTDIPRSKKLQNFLLNYDHPLKKISRPLLLNAIGKEKTEKLFNYFKNKNSRKDSMEPDTKKYLIGIYRHDILLLQDLINRDLSGWLE